MKKLTVGSCFSGIGGLELGLEWTGGFETKWQIEIDPYASAVLRKHWPDVQRFSDITTVSNPPRVDVICGGFPCQDVSLAGARLGLDGKRSTLWTELFRLVCEVKPRWLVAENVSGLLSSDGGRFFGNILRDLAGGGYDAEWGMLSAAGVGAPHLRRRIFILAHTTSARSWGEGGNALHQGRETSPTGEKSLSKNAKRENGFAIGDDRATGENAPYSRLFGQAEHEIETTGPKQLGEAVANPKNSVGRADGAPQDRPRQQFGGTGSPDQPGIDWWATEPNVGRVASRISTELDGGRINEQMDDQEKDATERQLVWEVLREMWINQEFTATPSKLRNRRVPDSLSWLPYKNGPTRWNPPSKENKELLNLWERVSSLSFKEAQHLLSELLERIGEAQRHEAMEPWIDEPNIPRVAKGVVNRVDRLRCLGNAVVPQVAQKVGEMILSCEENNGEEGK